MAAARYTIRTPLGDASCSVDDNGAVCELTLAQASGNLQDVEANPVASQLQAQLDEYFAGQRREFSLPFRPVGTEFQQRVWQELQCIPYGTTITYSELAARIGNPRAVRAVGRANGANPVWIIIPCHRVIGADGSLTGYAGGIEVKRRLLELEGVDIGGGAGKQSQIMWQ